MNRKLSAHYIITGNGKPIKNGIVTLDDSGKVLEVSQTNQNLQEISGLEFYSGVLVPGFVNAHCHLELSHLKGKIRKRTGLPGFVSQINQTWQAEESEILEAEKKADNYMLHNGIVAVGDISNTSHSFKIKSASKLSYHTFLEVFNTNPDLVTKKFESALELEKELKNYGLSSSIVPHAPYSVTPEMFELIKNHSLSHQKSISIHNQECSSENELYRSKSGELFDVFTKFGVDFSALPLTGKNSLESIMIQMPASIKTILVHNTYSTEADIDKANNYFDDLYWCMCPNANLYIENNLPNISLFYGKNQKICMGTDSLASNHQLSILEELKIISQNFTDIPVNELIKWATLNGAEALGLNQKFGSIEPDKTPGINLIKKFDLQNFRLKPDSELKRLV
jgi:cytosine/adenosine deaminase-related metal-dependent hydrolase